MRYELPDGRVLLDDVSFRVGEGAKVALVGANGAGKTTLLRIVTGELVPHEGAVTRSGGLGVMRQMVGRDATTVAELLLSVSPPRVQAAAAEVDRLELALMEADDESTQMAYAAALSEFADAGGYEIEVVWDTCCTSALGIGFDKAKYRELETLSGGEQKRLVLEYLLAGPDQVLLLDEPDNFLDVPGRSGWRAGSGVRRRRSCSSATTGSCWPTRQRAWSRWNVGGWEFRVDAPGWVRVVPRGAPRSLRPLRGAASPVGRGARQAQGAGAVLQDQGGVQRRPGLAVQGRPDPAAQVRGGRAADSTAARAAGDDAAHRRADRQAGSGL